MFMFSYLCDQLELQRQQLLADRQQFQRDQLKAAELRALQSPTLGPTTPLQFPPSRPPHRSPTLMTPAQPTATMAIIQPDAEEPKAKLPEGEVAQSNPLSISTAGTVAAVDEKSEEKVPITMATNVTDSVAVLNQQAEPVAMATPSIADVGVVNEGVEEAEEKTEDTALQDEELDKMDTGLVTTASLPTDEDGPPIIEATPTTVEPTVEPLEESSVAPPTDNGTTPTVEDAEATPIDEPYETTPISGSAPPADAITEAMPTEDDAPPPPVEVLGSDVVDETVNTVPDEETVTPVPDETVTPVPDEETVTPVPDEETVTPVPEETVTPVPDEETVTPVPDETVTHSTR